MKIMQIIGADVSKRSIDFFCHSTGKHICIGNELSGFKELLNWFKSQKIIAVKVFIVLEDTGLYSFRFENFLHRNHIAFMKVNALDIKLSIGLTRGKTDKIDAERIAAYGNAKRENLVAAVPQDTELKRLQMLHSTRDRLVRQRSAFLCAIKEYEHMGITEKDLLVKVQHHLVNDINEQVKKLEAEIHTIIKTHDSLDKNYQLLQTIKGVGPVLAVATIIKTNNFTRFDNCRKFACFCGTAPFEHCSGTSVKRKTRISHLADKEMKRLLDLSAKSAVQCDKELKCYYQRRLDMGKSKMSTINIVRNKIIYRMFAVVKRGTPFVENYLDAA